MLVRAAYRVDLIVSALESCGLPVGRWYGPRYDLKARKAVEACLAVARGRLSDRQALRLCQFVTIEDNGERVTRNLLSLISSPGVESLRNLNRIVWEGACPTDLLAQVR